MSATMVLYALCAVDARGLLVKVLSVHTSRQEAKLLRDTYPKALQSGIRVRRASLKILNA